MFSLKTCLILLVFLFSCAVQAQEYAENMPLATRSLILDVTRGENHYIAVGERGHVLLSEKGENWQQTSVNTVPTRATLNAVFAIGNKVWAVGHDAVILRSEDDGQTWQKVYASPEDEQPLMDVYFLDEKQGFALGAYGLFMKSADGGKSWEHAKVSDDDFHLNAMARLDANTLMIVGEAGTAYLSEDRGESWQSLVLPYEGSFFGLTSNDAGTVVAFGLRGHVYISHDRGENWQPVPVKSPLSLFGGTTLDDGRYALTGINSSLVIGHFDEPGVQFMQPHGGVDFSSLLSLPGSRLLLVGESGPMVVNLQENKP